MCQRIYDGGVQNNLPITTPILNPNTNKNINIVIKLPIIHSPYK